MEDLNSIPEGWQRKKIGEYATVKRGASPRPIQDPKWWGGDIGWVRISDVTASRKYLTKTRDYLSDAGVSHSIKITPGDVILSICATIGRPIITTVPVCIHDGFVWFDGLSEDIDREYFYYFLASNEEDLANKRQTGTQGNLNTGIVSNVDLLVPESKPEQAKIAEVLSTVDRAIEQTEALIAKQQRIKTGLMQDLLTRGIDEHGNLRSEETHEFRDSPLGRIPVEWEVVAVEQLGDIITGTTPSTAEASFYDGDVMFISPKDVSHEADLILDTEKKLSKKGLYVCRAIPKNSICTVCIGSTIGKMGMSIAKCATNQQINTLVPHEEKDAGMLYFSMNLFLPMQLRREAGLQAVPIVNKAVFSRMQLPVPKDENEKDRIRTVLASPSSQIAAQTKVLAKLRSLKTALMQDLLTGKVRVTKLLKQKSSQTQGSPK